MTVPYRYIKGAAAGRDETCVLCGSRRTDLVVDHCHQHGYARGLLCASCNGRLAVLDAGTAAPTPREAFYLGNCPECRKAESPDSPDAFALRIGTVALAVASALDLSPRQAAVLALSLAETELSGEDRKPGSERLAVPPRAKGIPVIPESESASLSSVVRFLTERGYTRDEIRDIVPTLPGYEGTKADSLKKALQRTRPKN